jgi:hypothetical protein
LLLARSSADDVTWLLRTCYITRMQWLIVLTLPFLIYSTVMIISINNDDWLAICLLFISSRWRYNHINNAPSCTGRPNHFNKQINYPHYGMALASDSRNTRNLQTVDGIWRANISNSQVP